MTDNNRSFLYSGFWEEEAEKDNPFTAAQCFCYGYDVYGDILKKASWIEYLYLMFLGNKPSPAQARILEVIAVALANPGPRDHSVQAAMCAGAGGSTMASALMASLAAGAGNVGGAREVMHCINLWNTCGTDLDLWQKNISTLLSRHEPEDIWPALEHPPGFDPNGTQCPTPVKQILSYLAQLHPDHNLAWLEQNRTRLEKITGLPLSLSGVTACAFTDLAIDSEKGELLYLLFRLPGAAIHSLEQRELGWEKFPFYPDGIELTDDPCKA